MKLTKKFRLIYDYSNIIINVNDYMIECNEGSETHLLDNFYRAYESNTLSDIYTFISVNNLTIPEGTIELNPFDSVWDSDYSTANIRLFVDSLNAMKLSVEQPEFVLILKQLNITLIVDTIYGGTWAYLEYILPEHKLFLEENYNAKFQYR